MTFTTEQEVFWAGEFGNEYMERNQGEVLLASNLNFYSKALRQVPGLESCIEFGANVGMDLHALNLLRSGIEQHAIGINANAAVKLREILPPQNVYNAAILQHDVNRTFDLALIRGVLIHINPEGLATVYEKLHRSAGKYLVICEYFNPTPVTIEYRGYKDRLFKADFCGEMLDRYPIWSWLISDSTTTAIRRSCAKTAPGSRYARRADVATLRLRY